MTSSVFTENFLVLSGLNFQISPPNSHRSEFQEDLTRYPLRLGGPKVVTKGPPPPRNSKGRESGVPGDGAPPPKPGQPIASTGRGEGAGQDHSRPAVGVRPLQKELSGEDGEAKPAGLTVRASRWMRPEQPPSISTSSDKHPHPHCAGLPPQSPLLSLTAISGAAAAPQHRLRRLIRPAHF